MIATVLAAKVGGARGTSVARKSDAEVVQACLDGDQRAWNELTDRFGRLVYSVARRYGLSGADADDVFQDVFTILYRKLGTVRDRSRLAAWLVSTTLRECYRVGQQRGRDAALGRDHLGAGPPADEQTVRWEQQHLVRQALRCLGPRGEQLLTALFSASGPPNYKAIAEQLGMTVGSIGPTRARYFAKLEKILVEMGMEPDQEGCRRSAMKERQRIDTAAGLPGVSGAAPQPSAWGNTQRSP